MKLPKITFRAMTFEENMDMMAMFIENDFRGNNTNNTDYFKSQYLEIKDIDFTKMKREQISEILQSKLKNKWLEYMGDYQNKVLAIQNNWNEINDSVMSDLSRRLNIDWPDDVLDIQARVGVMYSCPRYISQRMFDISINANMNTMREIAIHEACHFLYFEKWKELFNDHDERHYNTPHIIWYLSEAIIDPLLNNDIFRKYTNIELQSYKMFYETMIGEESVIDTLRRIVKQESIEQAIKDSYTFFLNNEELIKETKVPKQSKKL